MKHKELRAALVEAGWRFAKQVQSPDSLNQCDWYAWLPERPSDWPDCECNDKPPSFCIEPSVYNLTGRLHASSEFKLRGEMHGQWYDLRMYSVPLDETMQAIPTALAHLGAAWRAMRAQAAPAAVAGPSDAVAYIDIGAGGYLDLGSDLSDEALRKLPKGRHMLAIVGTYGVDGYAPVAAPTTQPEQVAQGDALNNTVRVPLDSLHADAAYLIGRLQLDTMDGARVVEIIRERIEAAKAALAAQAQEAAPAAQGDAEDAARYRWLRARWGRIADEYDGDSDQLVAIRKSDSYFEGWDVDPASLDRAIDAARTQAREGANHE